MDNVGQPETLVASFGGLFGSKFELEFRAGVLWYRADYCDPIAVTPTPNAWRVFRGTLDSLEVWNWDSDYPNNAILDGTQWALRVTYADRSISASGSNSYPAGSAGEKAEQKTAYFDRVLAAFSSLLGGRPFGTLQSFEVEGYLTESKLAEIIGALAPEGFETQFVLPGRRFRWDFKYQLGQEPGVLVEYDGDEHYRSTLVIKADREKARLAMDKGFTLVRFPYWLQLDRQTLRHFFGLPAALTQDFPHGFITTTLFPASFCAMGIDRFLAELLSLPEHLQHNVRASLQAKVDKHGMEYVVPDKLAAWFNAQPVSPEELPVYRATRSR